MVELFGALWSSYLARFPNGCTGEQYTRATAGRWGCRAEAVVRTAPYNSIKPGHLPRPTTTLAVLRTLILTALTIIVRRSDEPCPPCPGHPGEFQVSIRP